MQHHPDDRTLTPADYGNTVHDDSLGRIVQNGDDYDAWDFQHEYLGGFTNYQNAYISLIEAKEVHDWLVDRYNNR